jgi:hypothetical protein
MTRDCTSADLQMRAVVCQLTGEDWRGVSLRLSTAAPMSWTELPELGALRIGRAQPPPSSQRGFRPPPQGAASLFSDFDRGLQGARAAVPVIPSWQPPALDVGAPMLPPMRLGASGAMGGGAMESVASMAPDDMPVMEEQMNAPELKRDSAPVRRAPQMAMPPPAPAPKPPAASPTPTCVVGSSIT